MRSFHAQAQQPPRYDMEQNVRHLRILHKRIKDRLEKKQDNGRFWVRVKSVVMPLSYIALFVGTQMAYPNGLLFFGGYLAMGLLLVIIFLNVIHEVSHEIVFTNKWMNQAVLYFFDIMGANSYIWKNRHTLMHHNFPNVNGWDTDIEQSSIFKVFPDAPHTKVHNHQHRLMFLLYPLYLFNWLLVRDYKDFFRKDSMIKKAIKIPRIEYVKLFAFKMFYLFYMFAVPMLFFGVSFLDALLGFVLLTFTASVFALSVLLPPHANVGNAFPQVEDNRLNRTWLEHQLATTSDISNNNWFIAAIMGNFNYHVVHHLFPDISYVDMKEATDELEIYARENGFNYKKQTFWEALRGHYQLIRANAYNESIFDETF